MQLLSNNYRKHEFGENSFAVNVYTRYINNYV